MINKEAVIIVLRAARRLAGYCDEGSTICFDNYFDYEEGKTINEALKTFDSGYIKIRNPDKTGNIK